MSDWTYMREAKRSQIAAEMAKTRGVKLEPNLSGARLTSCGVKRVELPDLIIAATSRSSDSAAPMERFHNAAPLLRLVASTGTFTSEASMWPWSFGQKNVPTPISPLGLCADYYSSR